MLRNVFGLAIYAIINEFIYDYILIYRVKCFWKIYFYSLGLFTLPTWFSKNKVIIC